MRKFLHHLCREGRSIIKLDIIVSFGLQLLPANGGGTSLQTNIMKVAGAGIAGGVVGYCWKVPGHVVGGVALLGGLTTLVVSRMKEKGLTQYCPWGWSLVGFCLGVLLVERWNRTQVVQGKKTSEPSMFLSELSRDGAVQVIVWENSNAESETDSEREIEVVSTPDVYVGPLGSDDEDDENSGDRSLISTTRTSLLGDIIDLEESGSGSDSEWDCDEDGGGDIGWSEDDPDDQRVFQELQVSVQVEGLKQLKYCSAQRQVDLKRFAQLPPGEFQIMELEGTSGQAIVIGVRLTSGVLYRHCRSSDMEDTTRSQLLKLDLKEFTCKNPPQRS